MVDLSHGILNNWSSCSALNQLILIGKYLIYCKAINGVNLLFADFKAFISGDVLHQTTETEKYIAFSSNKCSTFTKKMGQILKLTINFNAVNKSSIYVLFCRITYIVCNILNLSFVMYV